MALTHLVDTSVVTRLSRLPVREVVESLAAQARLGRPLVVDLERCYTARNAREWDALRAALDAFPPLDVESRHVRRALQVQRLLAQRSQRGRAIPDLLVAAVAEAAELTVLHYDADFDLIADVTGQPVEWVVPRGTVD